MKLFLNFIRYPVWQMQQVQIHDVGIAEVKKQNMFCSFVTFLLFPFSSSSSSPNVGRKWAGGNWENKKKRKAEKLGLTWLLASCLGGKRWLLVRSFVRSPPSRAAVRRLEEAAGSAGKMGSRRRWKGKMFIIPLTNFSWRKIIACGTTEREESS